jgi:TrmH family RNA methyltransferase
MISKSRIRFIKSLQQKKYRLESNRFIIEGEKIVNEAFTWFSDNIESVYYTTNFDLTKKTEGVEYQEITEKELEQISNLKTPNKVIAICKSFVNDEINSNLIIALDGIQDPGNLGTIIRIADWYGIKDIICSTNTVDCYNPKVLQATMGAIFRVHVHYTDLIEFIQKSKLECYGALLNGNSIYTEKLNKNAIIVFGNEGNGISNEIIPFLSKPISIPKFGNAESLNVSSAVGIIVNAFFQSN